jgi:hypothetical protein
LELYTYIYLKESSHAQNLYRQAGNTSDPVMVYQLIDRQSEDVDGDKQVRKDGGVRVWAREGGAEGKSWTENCHALLVNLKEVQRGD